MCIRDSHRDVGVLHSGQHGGGGGGGHGHNDIYLVGHQVCTDLVQVGLVSLDVYKRQAQPRVKQPSVDRSAMFRIE